MGQMSKPMSTYGTPAIKDDVLYIGGYDGDVYAIDTTNYMMSTFPTDDAIIGSPVVAGDTLYIGSSDSNLYALYLDLREEPKWVFPTEGEIWSTPVVDNGVVYIGSSDHVLYAIDAESGTELWRFETEGAILSTPLVVDDRIYIGSVDHKFYAINITTHEYDWIFKEAESWFWTQALYHDGEIWAGSLDHNIYAINAESGDLIKSFETEGMVRTPPIEIQGQILVGSEDGYIYVIEPQEKKSDIIDLQPEKDSDETRPPIFAPL